MMAERYMRLATSVNYVTIAVTADDGVGTRQG